MQLKTLVGNGKKIGLLTAPFLVIGIIMNIVFPKNFSVGGPSLPLFLVSLVILIPGIFNWIWSVILIVKKISRKELIKTGPYAIIKHPLYVGVALLVLPWIGFIINTWLGALIGIIVYIGSRLYGPGEEKILKAIFGREWEDYEKSVKIRWI
jgi:protein-S-isoprenylcysteine O-methyltransferase Ste14